MLGFWKCQAIGDRRLGERGGGRRGDQEQDRRDERVRPHGRMLSHRDGTQLSPVPAADGAVILCRPSRKGATSGPQRVIQITISVRFGPRYGWMEMTVADARPALTVVG